VSLAGGCATGRRDTQRAFIDAGADVKKRQDPPTYDDLAHDLELFVERDIRRVREKARLAEEKELRLYRVLFVAGSAAVVLATSSGTLQSEGGDWKLAVGALGVASALTGVVRYASYAGDLRACQAFLDQGERDLDSFARVNLRRSAERVPREVWEDYVARTAAVLRGERCLRFR
jgi:hypothetical protein